MHDVCLKEENRTFLAFQGKSKVSPVHVVEVHMELEVWLQTFLNSTLGGGEWSVTRHRRLIFWRRTPLLVKWENL
jgi:hypothetical protein